MTEPFHAVVRDGEDPFSEFPGHVALLSFAEHGGGRRRRRAVEHARGRVAAGAALGHLGGATLASATVGADRDGCPVWPAGVTGSISHSAPFAAAAVAWEQEPGDSVRGVGVRGVGIDVEVIRVRHSALWERVVLPEDAAAAPPDAPLELVATVCLALREAVFKCVYPVLRAPMDWPDARFETDWHRGESSVTLDGRLGAKGTVRAAFTLLDGAVLAICWLGFARSVGTSSKTFGSVL